MTSTPLALPDLDGLLASHLRTFLGPVDEATVQAVQARMRWVPLPGGQTLMSQGEAGDAAYLLVRGRLRVSQDDGRGTRVVREIGRGEVVGEMSLYTDQPRSATLVAVRDSVLARLDHADFHDLLKRAPAASQALTRQIIRRLQSERAPAPLGRPVTMALVPVSEGVDASALAHALELRLRAHGRVQVVDAAAIQAQLALHGLSPAGAEETAKAQSVSLLLDRLEATHDQVLLVAEAAASAWTEMCICHADEVLLLANAACAPAVHDIEQRFLAGRPPSARPTEVLVLEHPADTRMPSGTAAWLARRAVDDHVHVRRGHAGDLDRLARLQARRAVGLVFAGGGARGLAHLGVMRALAEAGIEIDCAGGTSIGAVMATLAATDLPWSVATDLARRAFARSPTNDYALLPLVSLLRGRRLRQVIDTALRDAAGEDAGLEDLWKGCYCVATNYSTASEQVLRRGRLGKALRASIAIPGVLPPVVWEGDLLCDGGTFNNFPVDVMRRWRGVGTVIGVDLNAMKPRKLSFDEVPGGLALLLDRLRPRARRRWRIPSLPSLLINSTILYSLSRHHADRALTDLYLKPPLDRVGLLDWKKFDQVVAQGHAHAREQLSQDGIATNLRPAVKAPTAPTQDAVAGVHA